MKFCRARVTVRVQFRRQKGRKQLLVGEEFGKLTAEAAQQHPPFP
jgi:hypothetical protein